MVKVEHTLEIGGSFTGGMVPWCSCGWQGGESDSEEAAIEAWENHCDVAFMEATMAGAE